MKQIEYSIKIISIFIISVTMVLGCSTDEDGDEELGNWVETFGV